MYDTQALGLLALNGALLAVAIAAKEILEQLWWLSLLGLFASSVFCILALSRGAADMGLPLSDGIDVADVLDEDEIDEFVAKSFLEALKSNQRALKAKRNLISWAIIAMGVALFVAFLSGVIIS